MSGLLAIAIKEKRILVTNHYNRADHNGCKGDSPASLLVACSFRWIIVAESIVRWFIVR
jgi:hypothetical protein